MTNTHFHDNAEEIVRNRAYSYYRVDSSKFANAILSYSNAGATSLFTNANDLAKWIMNFYKPVVGDKSDLEILTSKAKLNNGKEISYALGISSDKQYGWTRYSHSGGDAGFRTFMSVFPDLKMGFLVFSNSGEINPVETTTEISELFISDTSQANSTTSIDSSLAILKDSNQYKDFAGNYISDEGINFKFKLKDGKMYLSPGSRDLLMVKTVNDTFVVIVAPNVKFQFAKDAQTVNFLVDGETRIMKKYELDTNLTIQQMRPYVGTYYCPELDCKYNIVVKDKKLFLTNNKYNDSPINILGERHMTTGNWWMGHLLVIRDSNKKITGFEVHDGRVLHLKFNKIK
jgi:hypothetical protein